MSFFDPEFMSDPYPVLAALRDEGPVHFDRQLNGWWALRHVDVADLSRNPVFVKDPRRAAAGPYTDHLLRSGVPSMLFSDGSEHRRLRALVNRAFTKRAVEALETRIQAITDDLLAGFAVGQPIDIVTALAVPLPILVIAEVIGVESGDVDAFKRWSEAIGRSFDPFLSGESAASVAQAFVATDLYLRGLIEEHRRMPRDDLTSALIAAEESDDGLTDDEIVGVLCLLVVAGNITTTDLIGNGVLTLLEHPAEWAKLCDRPELVANAVEELLRFAPPVVNNDRITTADTVIGGCPVPAGQWVWPVMAAANRDPDRFVDPDRFDIERPDIEHHTFGGGPHLCLGAPLARLEARVAFGTLARRFPGLLRDEDRSPMRKQVPFFHGLSELWIIPG